MKNSNNWLSIGIGTLFVASLSFSIYLGLSSPIEKIKNEPSATVQQKQHVACPTPQTTAIPKCDCNERASAAFSQITEHLSSLPKNEEEQMKTELRACFEKEHPQRKKPDSERTEKEREDGFTIDCIDNKPEACRQIAAIEDEKCKKGVHEACVYLAYKLATGRPGVPAAPQEAISMLEESCSQNDSRACSALGELLEKGLEGLPADNKRAMAAFQADCGMKDFNCDDVGRMLEKEMETNPEKGVEALSYYQKSCNAGSSLGCYHAFALSHKDVGTQEQRTAIEQKLTSLCGGERIDPYACRALAEQYARTLAQNKKIETSQ